MSEHRHLLTTDAPPERVELNVYLEQTSDRWHRVLNILWDEGVMASLSDRAFRVFGAFLRLRAEDGSAFATIGQLRTLTTYGDRSIFYARSELTAHPRRLLADLGSDRYDVLPGWSFAGRTPVQRDCTPVQQNCKTVQPDCVPHRERARPTNQPKTGQIDQNQSVVEPKARERCAGSVVGWPTLSRAGEKALAEQNVYALLMDLGVWEYMARPLGACLYITCDRVLRTAAEVSCDKLAGNRPICLGKRLAKSFGVHVPPPPTKTGGVVPIGLEGLAQLRAQRSAMSRSNA